MAEAMVIVCRRCGQSHTSNDVDSVLAWRDGHPCEPAVVTSIADRIRAQARPDLAHGDWRRYRSRTQRCTCPICHRAWLNHHYDTLN